MKFNIAKYSYLYLIGVLLIVSFVFLPTVNREWQMFDEKDIYYNEGLYPIPNNLSEAFEVISIYSPNFNFESQNLQFSNIVNIRSNPIGSAINILISYFFKKNPLPYHLLSVCIHVINTAIIWLIFQRLLNLQTTLRNSSNLLLSSIITLTWALHPVNIESIMMSTNWNSIFICSLYLIFIFYTLRKIGSDSFKNSKIETLILSLLFFSCILIVEYSYVFSLIIFFISFGFIYKRSASIQESVKSSISLSLPYFLGSLFGIIFYFSRHLFLHNSSYQGVDFSIERLLWFSPQIFVHCLKLIFYPKDLSVYQSNLVSFADSYFALYAILCLTVFILFLTLPFVFFTRFKSKNKFSFICPLTYCFIFSIFPFLQIITPTYCIFAERYCYFPLFLLLLIFTVSISSLQNKRIFTILFLLILIPLSVHTIIRLKDWNDSYSLYSSVIKTYKKEIYKGFGLANLGYYFTSTNNDKESEKYFSLSIQKLVSEIEDLRVNGIEQKVETLKVYGLDRDSIISNAAFRIASIKFYEFHEKATKILEFYKPFIDSSINNAGSSQLDLYAKLLLASEQPDEALKVLKFAKEKYPLSTTIIFSLSNFYLNQKDLINAEKIINEGLKYYPNYTKILPRAIKLYWLKKDLPNLAKYEYLLGLRTHSIEAYQKSLEIYLSLNQLNKAKKIIDKLLLMDRNNPDTLLLTNKYYSLIQGNNGN